MCQLCIKICPELCITPIYSRNIYSKYLISLRPIPGRLSGGRGRSVEWSPSNVRGSSVWGTFKAKTWKLSFATGNLPHVTSVAVLWPVFSAGRRPGSAGARLWKCSGLSVLWVILCVYIFWVCAYTCFCVYKDLFSFPAWRWM